MFLQNDKNIKPHVFLLQNYTIYDFTYLSCCIIFVMQLTFLLLISTIISHTPHTITLQSLKSHLAIDAGKNQRQNNPTLFTKVACNPIIGQ